MITALAKVDFEFQCRNSNNGDDDTVENNNDYKKEKHRKLRWIFPWFASYQSAVDSREPWPYRGNAPTQDQVCSPSKSNLDYASKMPLEQMADLIRNDVRKMALQLIGSRTGIPKRIHQLVPLDVDPWIPNIDVDDVIIHFPCYNDIYDGEFTTVTQNKRVGILQFREYTKRIYKDVESIGIITEIPREEGKNTKEVCHRASALLLEFLKEFYSNQSVSISIYKNDTFPLQYARIAMAKQSFSSFSTFGMIPIIGTFGEGYFQPSVSITEGNEDGQNNIIRGINSGKYEGFENIHLINGNVLSPRNISTMEFGDIAEWLSRSL